MSFLAELTLTFTIVSDQKNDGSVQSQKTDTSACDSCFRRLLIGERFHRNCHVKRTSFAHTLIILASSCVVGIAL